MIKFFTIILLLYYILITINHGLFKGTMNKLMDDLKRYTDIKDETEKEEFVMTRTIPVVSRFILLLIIAIPITIVELIYIFSAVQYGNKIITIGFIIWWFFVLSVGLIQNKFKKDKFEKVKRFSLWRLFVNLIDVAYFSYMYYILFLN